MFTGISLLWAHLMEENYKNWPRGTFENKQLEECFRKYQVKY